MRARRRLCDGVVRERGLGSGGVADPQPDPDNARLAVPDREPVPVAFGDSQPDSVPDLNRRG
jgi:hypothetical protein